MIPMLIVPSNGCPGSCPGSHERTRSTASGYAQILSLIEGPLRIADTDFPNRAGMLELAEWNVEKALAECAVDRRDP